MLRELAVLADAVTRWEIFSCSSHTELHKKHIVIENRTDWPASKAVSKDRMMLHRRF